MVRRRRQSRDRLAEQLRGLPRAELAAKATEAQTRLASLQQLLEAMSSASRKLQTLEPEFAQLRAVQSEHIQLHNQSLGLVSKLKELVGEAEATARRSRIEETGHKASEHWGRLHNRLPQFLRGPREFLHALDGTPLANARFLRWAHLNFDPHRAVNQATAEIEALIHNEVKLLKKIHLEETRENREAKAKHRVERKELLKAKVAAADKRSRALASLLRTQLRRSDRCPYCDGPLGEFPHADHIYPLVQGGLSVRSNLVLVCAECNMRKGTLTLREFVVANAIDRQRVEELLAKLGKRF